MIQTMKQVWVCNDCGWQGNQSQMQVALFVRYKGIIEYVTICPKCNEENLVEKK